MSAIEWLIAFGAVSFLVWFIWKHVHIVKRT